MGHNWPVFSADLSAASTPRTQLLDQESFRSKYYVGGVSGSLRPTCLIAFQSARNLEEGFKACSSGFKEQLISFCRLGMHLRQPMTPSRAVFVHKMDCSILDLPYHLRAAGALSKLVATSSTSAIVEFQEAESVLSVRRLPAGPFLIADYKPRRPRGAGTDQKSGERSTENMRRPTAQNQHNQVAQSQQRPTATLPTEGRGATNTPNLAPPQQPPPPIPPQQIRQDWTHIGETYVLGTKKLDRHLRPLGKRCGRSVADGNCCWDSVRQAGKLHGQSHRSLRERTALFFAANEDAITSLLYYGSVEGTEAWQRQMRTHLVTDGTFIDHEQLQILAWTLQRDVHIYDVFTPGNPTITSGQRSWDPHAQLQGPPIEVAYRPHNIYWIYSEQLKPIALSQGHYWPIHHIASRQSGNGQGPGKARPTNHKQTGASVLSSQTAPFPRHHPSAGRSP